MKLNDPFGRMEKRHQLGYQSMRDTMRHSGIDTPEAAREVIHQSRNVALKYTAIGMAALLLLTLLFPKSILVTLSLALFLVVWVAKSTINGQRYIQRYIKEELNQGKQDDS